MRSVRDKGKLFISGVFFLAALMVLLELNGWRRAQLVGDDEAEYLLGIMLIVLGVFCGLPGLVGSLTAKIDVFEPVHAFSMGTFIYFVLVPAILVRNDAFDLGGVDYRAELPKVLVVVFLALVGFYGGYYFLRKRSRASTRTSCAELRQRQDIRSSSSRLSQLLLVVFLFFVVLWIVVAVIPIEALWIFGEASYSDAWRSASGPQIGYLYGAREALPACLLLVVALRRGRNWPPLAVFLLAFLVAFFAGSGARFRVLLLVLSFFIFHYLERKRRPGLLAILVFVCLMFYFVIGAIGFYRGEVVQGGQVRGLAVGQDPFGVFQAWDTFVSGSSISVSSASLFRYVPKYVDYLWGKSFINVFTQPVPRFLWPDKPSSVGLEFFATLWPSGTTLPFWALFYLNFGPVGVVLGMAAFGALSRWIYDLYINDPENPFTQIQLALYYAYLIHMYGRGGDNVAFVAYGFLYVVLPVWLVWWVARRKLSKGLVTGAGSSAPRARTPHAPEYPSG